MGLCPTTEANLGDGIFEFVPWFEARGPWAVGGDSHVCVSPSRSCARWSTASGFAIALRNVIADEQAPDVAREPVARRGRGRGAGARRSPSGAFAAGRRADLVVLDGDDVDFEGLGASARSGSRSFRETATACAMSSWEARRRARGAIIRGEDAAGRRGFPPGPGEVARAPHRHRQSRASEQSIGRLLARRSIHADGKLQSVNSEFVHLEARMKALKGTKTHDNLKAAFAGESQANRRYLYFANKADVEGQNDVAALFRSTAEGETGHAHGHLDYLAAVGDPRPTCRSAARART